MSERMAVTGEDKAAQSNAVGVLCDWLQDHGFKVGTDNLAPPENECKWYAWRQLPADARDCGCNDKPPALIVTPQLYTMRDRQYASIEVGVTGQHAGPWFSLKAYSIGLDELPAMLPQIESALLRAWNAIDGASSYATALCQQGERNAKDAARYRWLTKNAYVGVCYTDQVESGEILEIGGCDRRVPDEVGEFCDVGKAIDAAMTSEGKTE